MHPCCCKWHYFILFPVDGDVNGGDVFFFFKPVCGLLIRIPFWLHWCVCVTLQRRSIHSTHRDHHTQHRALVTSPREALSTSAHCILILESPRKIQCGWALDEAALSPCFWTVQDQFQPRASIPQGGQVSQQRLSRAACSCAVEGFPTSPRNLKHWSFRWAWQPSAYNLSRTEQHLWSRNKGNIRPREVVNPAQALGMLHLMLRAGARPSGGPETSFPNRAKWTVGCKIWSQGQRRVAEMQFGVIILVWRWSPFTWLPWWPSG